MFGFLKTAFNLVKGGINLLKKKKKKNDGGEAAQMPAPASDPISMMQANPSIWAKYLPQAAPPVQPPQSSGRWFDHLFDTSVTINGRTNPNDFMSPYQVGIQDKPPTKIILWIVGGLAAVVLLFSFMRKKK